jgi:hypothetical protein
MPSSVDGRKVSHELSSAALKPIYLLSDSRPLFEKRADSSRLVDDLVTNTGAKEPSVTYLGASSGDDPSIYHEIFLPAFESTRVGERRMIFAQPSAADRLFLEQADIIVFGGGRMETGWRAFEESGLRTLIEKRYFGGALLLGTSAGAVLLGRGGVNNDGSAVITTFGFVPMYVGVHEEREDWRSLRRVLSIQEPPLHGLGIPAGGGVVYHAGEIYPMTPVFEIDIGVTGRREGKIYPLPKQATSFHQ